MPSSFFPQTSGTCVDLPAASKCYDGLGCVRQGFFSGALHVRPGKIGVVRKELNLGTHEATRLINAVPHHHGRNLSVGCILDLKPLRVVHVICGADVVFEGGVSNDVVGAMGRYETLGFKSRRLRCGALEVVIWRKKFRACIGVCRAGVNDRLEGLHFAQVEVFISGECDAEETAGGSSDWFACCLALCNCSLIGLLGA